MSTETPETMVCVAIDSGFGYSSTMSGGDDHILRAVKEQSTHKASLASHDEAGYVSPTSSHTHVCVSASEYAKLIFSDIQG